MSPGRRQAMIWTNAGILLTGPLGTNFNEILIEIYKFSFTKILFQNVVWKIVTLLSRPQCMRYHLENHTGFPLYWWMFIESVSTLGCKQNHWYNAMKRLNQYRQTLLQREQGVRSKHMMTSSNGNIFRVTGPLWGEFTGQRWIPLTNASDAELWCFLWSAPWRNCWVNNREAGDLRRHGAHYDVIGMNNKADGTVVWVKNHVYLEVFLYQRIYFVKYE